MENCKLRYPTTGRACSTISPGCARCTERVERADSTNVCYHPLIWSPKSVPDKYREIAVLLWLLALLERFEDLFT